MRKTLTITLFLSIIAGFSFAQCPANLVEIRVEIATDNWGYETSWTVTDIVGTVFLEGGQGASYANNTSYSDSTCVEDDGCFFFEIWDTFGDGIYTPNGYEVYVDEILVSSGSNDINDYAIATAHCPSPCNMTTTALNDLQGHINGGSTLTAGDLLLIKSIFEQFPECLAETEAMILLGKSVVEDFDDEVGALFTTPNTVNGFSKDAIASPGMEMEHAMVALEQGILDYVFSPEVYTDYPQHIYDWKFNTCFTFPGYVDPPADSSLSISTLIRANFADPDGANPYFETNSDQTDHALRPTGLYLSPGSIATVTVPDSLVGQGYFVRVGSHDWDLHIRPNYHRLDRISKKFPIESNTVEVFNPFGGAISILVPYGADDGILEVSVNNGVECPFFSLKPFDTTTDFSAELNKPGPWAVFETDNVMFTIPSHSIVPGQYDLMQAMLDWDAALQGVNSIMARQIISDKHNMYMIADITIRHNVYSIGYPMSNTPLRFTDVPGPAYFMNGPGPDDRTTFHESGHALAMTKFPGEVEALVNFPYIMAMNYGLNQDLNEAINYSFVPNTFDLDKTATHRMVSNSFGTERDIANATTNEVRYQHRGYGHYFEIVNMLGWCPLRNFWKQEFIDTENGEDYGINDQEIDLRTVRMSVAAQADLRPLFHVFGILPQDSPALQDTIAQIGIQPSLTIYNRLQDYFDLIPADNAEFIDYALFVYPNLYTDGPNENPDYGVGWHYQKSLTYDAAEAQQRTDILQGIVDLYFPNGVPTGAAVDVCCALDTINVSLVNEEVIVTGGVEPLTISVDTSENVQTVTVVDFDGCEATVQYTISGLSEVVAEGLRVFPNPSTGKIQIDFGTLEDQVTISALDLRGGLIQTKTVSTTGMVAYRLPEVAGVYFLKITYSDGRFDAVRIVKE
jgi:hypothetical protein